MSPYESELPYEYQGVVFFTLLGLFHDLTYNY